MNSGGTPSRSEASYYGGNIPWAKISDMENTGSSIITQTEEWITESGLKSIGNKTFPTGTLLLAMYGASVGKMAFAGTEISANQAILGIRAKSKEVIDQHYLGYWFKSIKEKLVGKAVGGAQPNISLGIVKDLQIPLPPLATQKRIAAILDAADALRRKDQALLQKYDELAQAIFVDMFGDPVKNEKGWEVKSLGEIFPNFKYGTNQKSNESSEGIPVLRIPNIIGNQINLTDLKHSQLDEKEMMTTQLKKGDLLFVRTNGNPNYIGRSALFLEDGQFSYASYLIRARMAIPNIPFCNYIQYALSYKTYRPIILKKATTTAGNYNINTDSLKNLTVPVPSQELMETFFEELRIIGNLSRLLSNTRFSETLFQSLLQKAFNAELVP